MNNPITRRSLITTAGAAAAAAAIGKKADAAEADDNQTILIVGVSCSPRQGMTTATSMAATLEAAKAVDQRIETILFDLGGMKITVPDAPDDDFEKIATTLRRPELGGLIIGSPSYYRSLTGLCKTFIDRLSVVRTPTIALADKPVGALSVGAGRNGGQELVINQILMAMLSFEMLAVGGRAPAFLGATLWNHHNDDITKDEPGMEMAGKLGTRIAEAAIQLR